MSLSHRISGTIWILIHGLGLIWLLQPLRTAAEESATKSEKKAVAPKFEGVSEATSFLVGEWAFDPQRTMAANKPGSIPALMANAVLQKNLRISREFAADGVHKNRVIESETQKVIQDDKTEIRISAAQGNQITLDNDERLTFRTANEMTAKRKTETLIFLRVGANEDEQPDAPPAAGKLLAVTAKSVRQLIDQDDMKKFQKSLGDYDWSAAPPELRKSTQAKFGEVEQQLLTVMRRNAFNAASRKRVDLTEFNRLTDQQARIEIILKRLPPATK